MRFVIVCIVVFLLAVAFKPSQASVPAKQAELPPKLIEEMAALPKKLEIIESRISLVESAKADQDETIDEVKKKADDAVLTNDMQEQSIKNLTEFVNKIQRSVEELENRAHKVEGALGANYQVKVIEPAKAPAVSKPASVVKQSGSVVSNGTYSQADGYRSQWTYPGDIASHVATVHGISTAGKTKEQLEREHDAAHNGTRVTYAVPAVVRSTVRYQPQVRSNCPGGNCPTGPSVQRWSVFRRR